MVVDNQTHQRGQHYLPEGNNLKLCWSENNIGNEGDGEDEEEDEIMDDDETKDEG